MVGGVIVVGGIGADCGGGVMMGVARLSDWFNVLVPTPDKF